MQPPDHQSLWRVNGSGCSPAEGGELPLAPEVSDSPKGEEHDTGDRAQAPCRAGDRSTRDPQREKHACHARDEDGEQDVLGKQPHGLAPWRVPAGHAAGYRFSIGTGSIRSAGWNPRTFEYKYSSASRARRMVAAWRNPCCSPSKARYAVGIRFARSVSNIRSD